MKKSEIIHGLTAACVKDMQQLHNQKFRPIDKALIKKLMRHRPSEGHKGDFGHALLIAGSEGKYGAAILASMAALRTGCGLVTTLMEEDGVNALLSALPEAMTKVRKTAGDVRDLDLSTYDAIGIGPGIGITRDSAEIFFYLLENYKGSLIIDADAITILSHEPQFCALLNENMILTPHPGEFSRLVVTGSTRKDQIDAQLHFQKKYRSVMVLKGKNTTVVNGKGLYYNTTGNSGLATGGSGDVLTGIITSLCAQDYSPADAAIIGTFMHGYAGDEAAKKMSEHSLIASDIIKSFPDFFRKFEARD